MLSLLASVVLAQKSNPAPFPQPAAQSQASTAKTLPPKSSPTGLQDWWRPPPQDVRSLPGGLDKVPVFYSNSPEVIRQSGILLSTFSPKGKRYPQAHLNYAFEGRFNIFSHHVARAYQPDRTPTLYKGLMLYNPSRTRTIAVDVLQAASFLGTPDAPFIDLPSLAANDFGRVFSGPGSRVVDVILRGRRQAHWPSRVVIRPGQTEMLMNLPVPVPRTKAAKRRTPGPKVIRKPSLALAARRRLPQTGPSSSNTRSTLLHLRSDGPVHVASMALLAPLQPDGRETFPTLDDWRNLLFNGGLLTPRDIPPSPLNSQAYRFFYGRVAGVSRGSTWKAQVTDSPETQKLTIPRRGQAFAYGLSTLPRGTFGTGQIQSAPMLLRYPDTAYLSHGNYGVHYQLTMPLHNSSSSLQSVIVSIDTPLKQDQVSSRGLRFLQSPAEKVFFRGTVRVRYKDDGGSPQTRYFHLVQFRGQQGDPLVILNLKPNENRLVEVDYLYPPDATPPQVLTISTLPRPLLSNSANEPKH